MGVCVCVLHSRQAGSQQQLYHSTAHSSKCGEGHVVGWCRKLNTDLFYFRQANKEEDDIWLTENPRLRLNVARVPASDFWCHLYIVIMSGLMLVLQKAITYKMKEVNQTLKVCLCAKPWNITTKNPRAVSILPQWFALNADFGLAVFEKRRRRLLDDMLNTKSWLQILIETFHKHQKVIAVTNVAWDRLWNSHSILHC